MARRALSLSKSPPRLEPLEGRQLFATHVVETWYGPWLALRDAVNAAAPGDTIDFTKFRGTIDFQYTLTIDKDLTLIGPGSSKTTLSAYGRDYRFFNITPGHDVRISGARFDDANADHGGAIYMDGTVDSPRGKLTLDDVVVTNSTADGGAVYGPNGTGGGLYAAFTDVTLTRCRFAGNTASGGIGASGGGIYLNTSSITAYDSTFDANTAHATGDTNTSLHDSTALGGGVALVGSDASTFTNCTFANNTARSDKGSFDDSYAEAHGGGLFVLGDDNLTIINCTFAGNSATGTSATTFGGGLDVMAFGTADPSPTHTLKVVNSVIAANTADVGPDAFGLDVTATAFANLKNNVIGDGTYSGVTNGVSGNLVGTAMSRINPRLNALGDNGGGIPTMMPQSSSPLLGAASAGETPPRDARGYSRSGPFDIGAVERQDNYAPSLTVWPADVAVANTPFNTPIAAVDPDGNAISFTLLNAPAWLSLVDNGNGTAKLVGTPTVLDGQATAMTLRTTDGQLTSEQTLLLAVYVEPVTLDSDGMLRVVGTESADVIKVWQPRGSGTPYRVMVGKRTRNYAADTVKAIQIFGLSGDDTIVGNPADLGVYVNAGDGNDTVIGSANADSLTAAAGDDEVWGMEGNDWIDGNGGRDRIYAGDGDDRVYGGNGNDTLDGGLGRDVLYGEVGSNLYLTADRNRDWVFATNIDSNFVQGDLDRDLLTNAQPLPEVAAKPRRRR